MFGVKKKGILLVCFVMVLFCFSYVLGTDVMCQADVKICPDGTSVSRIAPNCVFATCPTNVICQSDAKICPDGTSVSRIAPDCEFAACPTYECPLYKISCDYGRIEYETDSKGCQKPICVMGKECPVYDEPICPNGKVEFETDADGCKKPVCITDSCPRYNFSCTVGEMEYELDADGCKKPFCAEKIDGYRYLSFMCSNGETYEKREISSCVGSNEWKNYSKEYCKDKCSQDTNKCDVISFSLTSKCTLTTKIKECPKYNEPSCPDGKIEETQDSNGCKFSICVKDEYKKYRYAYVECYNEKSEDMGSSTSCKTLKAWNQSAKDFCKDECSSDSSDKCGVDTFRVSEECDDKEPKKENVSETVKCIFKGSIKNETCSSTNNKYSCSGNGSCSIDVDEDRGTKISWKSSCFGKAKILVDEKDEIAEFNCTIDTHGKCYDSDSGMNPFVYGEAISEDGLGMFDYCNFRDSQHGVLMEAVCLGNNVSSKNYNCPKDYPFCNKGVCSNNPGKCIDSDDINITNKGYVEESRNFDGPVSYDYCTLLDDGSAVGNCTGDNCGIREYYCLEDGLNMGYMDVPCISGCNNSKCKEDLKNKGYTNIKSVQIKDKGDFIEFNMTLEEDVPHHHMKDIRYIFALDVDRDAYTAKGSLRNNIGIDSYVSIYYNSREERWNGKVIEYGRGESDMQYYNVVGNTVYGAVFKNNINYTGDFYLVAYVDSDSSDVIYFNFKTDYPSYGYLKYSERNGDVIVVEDQKCPKYHQCRNGEVVMKCGPSYNNEPYEPICRNTASGEEICANVKRPSICECVANPESLCEKRCITDIDCDDGDLNTEDTCHVGTCWNKRLNVCVDGDGFCGLGCTKETDNDCIICDSKEDCDDENACTIDSCNNKGCAHTTTMGCNFEGTCIPSGVRHNGNYCSAVDGNIMLPQKEGEALCENSFECKSGSCLNGSCVEGGLINKFLQWISNLIS